MNKFIICHAHWVENNKSIGPYRKALCVNRVSTVFPSSCVSILRLCLCRLQTAIKDLLKDLQCCTSTLILFKHYARSLWRCVAMMLLSVFLLDVLTLRIRRFRCHIRGSCLLERKQGKLALIFRTFWIAEKGNAVEIPATLDDEMSLGRKKTCKVLALPKPFVDSCHCR